MFYRNLDPVQNRSPQGFGSGLTDSKCPHGNYTRAVATLRVSTWTSRGSGSTQAFRHSWRLERNRKQPHVDALPSTATPLRLRYRPLTGHRPMTVPPPSGHANGRKHFTATQPEKKDSTAVVGLPLGEPVCREPGVARQFIMPGCHTAVPGTPCPAPQCSDPRGLAPKPRCVLHHQKPASARPNPPPLPKCSPRSLAPVGGVLASNLNVAGSSGLSDIPQSILAHVTNYS